jgi:hypothetical protein
MSRERESDDTPRTNTGARRKVIFAILLACAFLFRLSFGLCSDFWTDDEKQIYLIGLKFYATHSFPYFGPDVTPTVQIPGALQGLLVGLPFFIWHAPEAPYVLLNLLSFASLSLLAWYFTRRLPEIPQWIIWAWLLTAPWTLNLSTHILNPSYVLTGASLFFVGWLETCPHTRRALVGFRLANFMQGFGLLWVMQLHMSWVVLAIFAAASVYFQLRERGTRAAREVVWMICGAALPCALLVPTFLKYGLANGAGDTGALVVFNAENLKKYLNPVEGILGRFLSLASFELPRFVGRNTSERLAFVRAHLWLAPIVAFLTVVGLLQPALLIILWFKRAHAQHDWRAIKLLTLSTLALLYALFAFSFRPPHSHTFYVTLPLAMLYSFYCWSPYLTRRRWQIFAAIILACSVVFHTTLALDRRARTSLYTNRAIVQSAINARDYHILGERREGARY